MIFKKTLFKVFSKIFFIFATFLTVSPWTFADTDPSLWIQTKKSKVEFKRSQLLKRTDLETLVVENDVAYHVKRNMTYKVIAAHKLFIGLEIEAESALKFKCLDGFSAPISKDLILNSDPQKSLAYIAIEEPDHPWPAYHPEKGGSATPGPFYLVWKNPKISGVAFEQWPFQLSSFEEINSIEVTYPKTVPDLKLAKTHPVNNGFEVFHKNCFACHTMNLSGDGTIAPDLNIPMNPTEYMKESALRTFIRNPQNLRYFPSSKMSAFSETVLPEKDLNDLIAYLKHMAKRKQQPIKNSSGATRP